jgi:hypothetical protein
VTADTAPPQLSPDGHWWWTGAEWVPAQDRPTEPPVAFAPVEPYAVQATVASEPISLSPTPFQILPAGYAPPVKKKGALKTIVAAGAATAVLAAAGAAFAIGTYLSGGGQQPEAVLPANAVAVMKVDLDPSFGQKKALFEIARKFPSMHVKSADSIRDDVLGAMVSSAGMDYAKDVKPWLGDRVAVAAVPDVSSTSGFTAIAAVQFKDRDKAKHTLGLAALRAGDSPFAFAFSGDYAIIADTQAQADGYAHSASHLADNASYKNAVAALGGDQIAVAWADMHSVYRALPQKKLRSNPLFSSMKVTPTGAFVVGVHVGDGFVEMQGKPVGGNLLRAGAAALGATRTSNLISSFPADVAAAVEVTGLGPAMTQAFRSMVGAGDPLHLAAKAKGFGLNLPADLGVLLGDDTAVGVLGDITADSPTLVAHVKTKQPDRAVSILKRAAALPGSSGIVVKRDATGYVLATDAASLKKATTGHLGSSPSFQRALPDAKTASMAIYVNFSQLPTATMPELGGLDALGMTVDGKTGTFRLRLTVS